MFYEKDGTRVYTTFHTIENLLTQNGFTADNGADISLEDRVEALEGAVVEMATEVYKSD